MSSLLQTKTAQIAGAVALVFFGLGAAVQTEGASDNWPAYLGDAGSSQFSELKQINAGNVRRLEVAWTYRAGGADRNNRSQIQCNPLVIDGVLYGTTPDLQVFALAADTGRELWRFDPASIPGVTKSGVNRGLVHWASGDDARILFGNDHFLHALDAKTGRPVAGFGDGGHIDLKDDLGRDVSSLSLRANTPGVVFGDLLILGMRLGEGPAPAAPGHIRAYDIRTGKLVWRFNTIPQPSEAGYETWPKEAYRRIGGANVWTGFALDAERGIVFCPTGSAAFDFWGGNRVGQDLYANCLIALDAKTGRRLWHFQFVHHDLWDRDLPAPPNLVTVTHNGRKIDAVAQVTKSGHVFLFNRETGEPLFPIEEKPVPGSDLIGEAAWPTQPLPNKPEPFARQVFSADQITDLSPEAHRAVMERFVKIRPHVPFMPPSREGTVIFPGFDGGAEWGGAAVDPRKGVLYVNANEMAWILTMVETKQSAGDALSSGEAIFTRICAACHGLDRRGNAAQNVPALVGVEQRLRKADVLALLATGKGVMPSFGFLSSNQREMVADYLLGEKAPAAVNDAARKEELSDGVALDDIPYTTTGYNRWLDPNGYPAIKPPWGTLNAIDLNTGAYLWRVPLGEYPELTAKGVPVTGAENYGGPIVTAGGLIFIGSTKDEMFRAVDQKTGKILWQTKLPAGGYATPATYRVGKRQFVVIACGGGKMGTRSGDSYLAFALPE